MSVDDENVLDAKKMQNKLLLEDISKRLFHIENAYLLRREIYLHFNKAVNSESSMAYVEVINNYKGFFLPLLESALSYSLVGLNALLSSNDKKSLQKLINKVQAQGLADLRTDLDGLREKHTLSLKIITDMRRGYFAHFGDLDLNSVSTVSDEAYISLFDDTKKLENDINAVFGNTVWYMDNEANETIKDTHNLMDALLRGESQRINEIHVEYISNIFKDGRAKWLKADIEETT